MSYARPRPSSSFEIALIVAIFSGWFIIASINAVMTGFPAPTLSDRDAIGLIVLECVAFAVAATVLYARGWRKNDFAFRVTWWLTLIGVILFLAVVFIDFTVLRAVGALLGGVDFVEEFGRSISLSLPLAALLSVINGAFEEFFLTRYLIEALAEHGVPIALGVSSLVRVMYHLYQGPTGAVAA